MTAAIHILDSFDMDNIRIPIIAYTPIWYLASLKHSKTVSPGGGSENWSTNKSKEGRNLPPSHKSE